LFAVDASIALIIDRPEIHPGVVDVVELPVSPDECGLRRIHPRLLLIVKPTHAAPPI
jgi:hypothetical protein